MQVDQDLSQLNISAVRVLPRIRVSTIAQMSSERQEYIVPAYSQHLGVLSMSAFCFTRVLVAAPFEFAFASSGPGASCFVEPS